MNVRIKEIITKKETLKKEKKIAEEALGEVIPKEIQDTITKTNEERKDKEFKKCEKRHKKISKTKIRKFAPNPAKRW